MKVTIRRVHRGDEISMVLGPHSSVPAIAPDDGVLITQPHMASVYIRISDFERFWKSDADSAELDSWREGNSV